jgi:ribosomal protein S12 methylthiotransferase accessory factor
LLLQRYAAAGVTVMVWDVSTEVGLPVFVAIICDSERHTSMRPVAAAFGSGCHADRRVALSRTLTEAAQSRLTGIAGSRDDLTRATYHASQSQEAVEYHQELARGRTPLVAFRDAPTFESDSLGDDLLHVLDCLRGAGIERVVVVDLSFPELPVAVVRTVVPGLEGPSESQWFSPGPRVRARWSTQ